MGVPAGVTEYLMLEICSLELSASSVAVPVPVPAVRSLGWEVGWLLGRGRLLGRYQVITAVAVVCCPEELMGPEVRLGVSAGVAAGVAVGLVIDGVNGVIGPMVSYR